MKKYLPILVCGFGAGVLNIVPFVKNFSCCLIIPVAAVFALYLDQKANGTATSIKAGKALIFGLLTGITAAIFGTFLDLIIIYITKTNQISSSLPEIEKLVSQLPASPVWNEVMDLMYKISSDISSKGFSLLYSISLFVSSFIINSVFGMVGGLLGMQFLNKRNSNQ